MSAKYILFRIAVGVVISAAVENVLANNTNDKTSSAEKHNEAVVAGLQRYTIPMQDCAIEFVAKKGGSTQAYMGTGGPYGYFSEAYAGRHEGRQPVEFGIRCHKGAAFELCPKLLPAESAENIQYYKIIRFKKWHPTYFSIAQISSSPLYTFGAGQLRKLYFCLGSNSRTLEAIGGGIVLGYDSRDVSETVGKKLQKSSEVALPEALEIIKSIRFISTGDE